MRRGRAPTLCRTPGACLAVAVILATIGACASWVVGPDEGDRARVFDVLWTDFDRHYPFFGVARIDWDSLRGVYRPQAVAATSDAELFSVLCALLGELRDPHVALDGDGIAWRYPPTRYPSYFSPRLVFRKYVPSNATTPVGRLRYGMAARDIGYVWIPSFAGTGWAGEIDQVLAALPAARALIVDVRDNSGGSSATALAVATRFADRERTWGYVRFRDGPTHSDFTGYVPQTIAPGGAQRFSGPVVVLTNRRVLSAAEEFVLAMRAMPAVITMGDTTGGASASPGVRELPNGWTYQMSRWMEYTPEYRIFERIGLAPDVPVRPPSEDVWRLRADPMLEAAAARLRAEIAPGVQATIDARGGTRTPTGFPTGS